MNFDFMDRRSAERFAELLDETVGPRHHSRGPADEQLAELVAIGNSLSAAKLGVRVDPEFRTGLRAMLVATAERDGIGRTATAVENEPVTGPATTSRAGLRYGLLGRGGRRIRARGAIVIGVAAGAMAVSGISAASENAAPGDALYGVKRSTEKAQLAMAGSDINRGQLALDFARTRLAEAAGMARGDTGFAGVLDDMDGDTRKGVRLLTTAAVARRDSKPLTTVDDFVGRQRRTLLPVLDRLSPAGRERALTSLSLLDTAGQRSEELRQGLACTPITETGNDPLGPTLRDCRTNAGSPTTSRQAGQTGKASTKPGRETKVNPQRTDPATAPGPGSGTVPGRQGATTGPGPAPLSDLPSKAGTPSGGAEQNGDVLGGLLPGLF